MTRVLIATVALAVFAGCGSDDRVPTKEEIVGVYQGRYAGGVETFEIDPDGSFSQVFRQGSSQIYSAKGSWTIQVAEISFRPFMFPAEVMRLEGPDKAKQVDVGSGGWRRDPIHIEIGQWPYHVAKVKGKGATVEPVVFNDSRK